MSRTETKGERKNTSNSSKAMSTLYRTAFRVDMKNSSA